LNKFLPLSALLIALLASNHALARNDKALFSLEDALNTSAAKEKLDPTIKLYFGNQSHAKVTKEIGEWKTNKKTNGFNKTDKEACEWVFLTAALELQERAKKEGGDAVINIKSNYKNEETSSDTQYMCGNGTFTTGVAFKGTVVKFK
jgi:uncharacterized protein YbjQ (UPF0145 family)